jgi:diguanylate cyclase (GGDEF)-like protein
MLDEHNHKIDLVYISEMGNRIPSVQIGITEGLSGYVISNGQALITGNFDQTHTGKVDSISVGDADRETQSVLAVPMKRGEKTIGMLSAQCFETNAYDEHDQQLLEMLTSHAQLALENANLFAEVQRLAITDGLTGLYNRFYFDQQLSLEFDRAQRYERSLGMVIIDPDNFKQVNDQFGHPAGDVVLMMFAELIKNGARKSDIVARYGGDEFVILLPETDLSGTLSLAEKIRDAVSTHTFQIQDHDIRFTTSIGVAATSGQKISDPDILTKQADQALYQAKRMGRNQVCCNSND